MTSRDHTMTDLDRWVLGSLTLIAVALIIAAGLSDQSELFLGYLAGPCFLGFMYFTLRN